MNQFILLKTIKATSPVTLHDISATCEALSLLEESIPGQGYGGMFVREAQVQHKHFWSSHFESPNINAMVSIS